MLSGKIVFFFFLSEIHSSKHNMTDIVLGGGHNLMHIN